MKVLELCFISDSDKPDNKQDTQSTANTPLSLSLSLPPTLSLARFPTPVEKKIRARSECFKFVSVRMPLGVKKILTL